jgi:hypothetical protein
MTDLNTRIQRVIEEIVGNEALLEMLETEAATEMLNWGLAMAKSIAQNATGLSDVAEELALVPRLKAIRQTMRSVGNWATGKYVDPAERARLRDKLLERFRIIFGEDAPLPSADRLDELLNRVDDQAMTPHQLVSMLRAALESSMQRGSDAQTQKTE